MYVSTMCADLWNCILPLHGRYLQSRAASAPPGPRTLDHRSCWVAQSAVSMVELMQRSWGALSSWHAPSYFIGLIVSLALDLVLEANPAALDLAGLGMLSWPPTPALLFHLAGHGTAV
jgi:hypothetical protein